MTPQDIDYLRAELSRAQQHAAPGLMVRTNELQALLDRLRHLELLPQQPVRIFGFVRDGEKEELRKQKTMTVRVRRVANEWYTNPVYVPQELAL